MGRLSAARAACAQATALAEETGHPYMLALAAGFGAVVACESRDPSAALELAERALDISARNGLAFWLAVAKVIRGWARAHRGEAAAALLLYGLSPSAERERAGESEVPAGLELEAAQG